RGYEYYDYRHDVVNTTFVNYQDNDRRNTGALSWLLFTGAGVTTENTIQGAQFVNAKPVYFPNIDPRFDNDNRGGQRLPDGSGARSRRLGGRHGRRLHPDPCRRK